MPGIFVSGGSGLGKTTLIKSLNEEYNIPLMSSFIRDVHNKFPEINELSFNDKQYIYEVGYYKIHQNPDMFLADRSIFDVYVRTGRSSNVVRYLGLEDISPSLLIIVPTPSVEWYLQHIDFFLYDHMRCKFYMDKSKSCTSTYDPEKIRKDWFAEVIQKIEIGYESKMKKMAQIVNWSCFIPSIHSNDLDTYQDSWQEQAREAIIKTWGLPRFSK